VLTGYALKLAAVAAFVVLMWPRVKPFAQEPTPLWKRPKSPEQDEATK
jgi:hypothetical protein